MYKSYFLKNGNMKSSTCPPSNEIVAFGHFILSAIQTCNRSQVSHISSHVKYSIKNCHYVLLLQLVLSGWVAWFSHFFLIVFRKSKLAVKFIMDFQFFMCSDVKLIFYFFSAGSG